jgi:hypothetical protein
MFDENNGVVGKVSGVFYCFLYFTLLSRAITRQANIPRKVGDVT